MSSLEGQLKSKLTYGESFLNITSEVFKALFGLGLDLTVLPLLLKVFKKNNKKEAISLMHLLVYGKYKLSILLFLLRIIYVLKFYFIFFSRI